MIRQAARFGLVGIIATAVHLAIGATMIFVGVPPATANVFAFLIAVGVSFTGHFYYTFPKHTSSHIHAFWRFTAVALIGFLINQLLLIGLLLIPSFANIACLVASTAFAASISFLLSKRWVFA